MGLQNWIEGQRIYTVSECFCCWWVRNPWMPNTTLNLPLVLVWVSSYLLMQLSHAKISRISYPNHRKDLSLEHSHIYWLYFCFTYNVPSSSFNPHFINLFLLFVPLPLTSCHSSLFMADNWLADQAAFCCKQKRYETVYVVCMPVSLIVFHRKMIKEVGKEQLGSCLVQIQF